jgi:hypothetical protein
MSTLRRLREVAEPRPDSSERAHETASPQQLAPQTAARSEETVEPLLVHLVHMQQTIGCFFAVSGVLDVLADDPDALFVAATKEIAAVVVARGRLVYRFMIVLVGHGHSLSDQLVLVERPHLPKL